MKKELNMSTEKRSNHEQTNARERGAEWLVYTIIGLLAATLIISLWNTWLTRNLQIQILGAISAQQTRSTSGVFLSANGWKLGQLAPDIEVRAVDGQSYSFAEIAVEHEVIYVGWNNCPVCLEHFPELNRIATEVESAGGSFTMVILLSEASTDALSEAHTGDVGPISLANMQSEYRWNFPVFEFDRSSLIELNLQATPTVLILRRGVLGEAFISSSFERMIERTVSELRLGSDGRL
jgi:hypothetical protein